MKSKQNVKEKLKKLSKEIEIILDEVVDDLDEKITNALEAITVKIEETVKTITWFYTKPEETSPKNQPKKYGSTAPKGGPKNPAYVALLKKEESTRQQILKQFLKWMEDNKGFTRWSLFSRKNVLIFNPDTISPRSETYISKTLTATTMEEYIKRINYKKAEYALFPRSETYISKALTVATVEGYIKRVNYKKAEYIAANHRKFKTTTSLPARVDRRRRVFNTRCFLLAFPQPLTFGQIRENFRNVEKIINTYVDPYYQEYLKDIHGGYKDLYLTNIDDVIKLVDGDEAARKIIKCDGGYRLKKAIK
jgi:hypothetical protein